MKNNEISFLNHYYENCNYEITENNDNFIMYYLTNYEVEFNLEIYLNEETIIVYGYQSDDYVYLSNNEENLYNMYNENENISMKTYSIVNTCNVYGTLKWKDSSNNSHPLRGVIVEVYCGNNVLYDYETIYTDDFGYFSCEIDDSFSNIGVFLKDYPGNDALSLLKTDETQYFNTETTYEKTGDNYNFGTIEYSVSNHGDFAKACQIGQAAITLNQYAEEMSGHKISHCDIVYPHADTEYQNISLYDNGCIYISDYRKDGSSVESYEAWDVTMHEYGHHLECEFDITANIGGVHYSKYNNSNEKLTALLEENEGYQEPKRDNYYYPDAKRLRCKLAWAESWPTFIAFAAQNYYKDKLQNIYGVGDYIYQSNNMVENVDYINNTNDSLGYGEDCENALINFFVRMYNECDFNENDYFDLTDKQIWDLVINSEAKSFSEFINYCYENMTIPPSKINNPIFLGKLLSQYNISKELVLVGNNVDWSQYKTTLSEMSSYNDGSFAEFLNIYSFNRYELVVWDGGFNEIYSRNLTEEQTTFTNDEIQYFNSSYGSKYYIGIYCFQDCSNGENKIFNTGGYLTNIIEVQKPLVNIEKTIYMNNDDIYYESIDFLTNSYSATYYVTFDTTKIALLQTFSLSPIDPYIEVYKIINNQLVYVTEVDDEGQRVNPFMYFTFEKNIEYAIRVTIINSTEGNIKFTLTITEDFYDTYSDIENIAVYNTSKTQSVYFDVDVKIYTLFIKTGEYTISATNGVKLYLVNENNIVEYELVDNTLNLSITDIYHKYYLIVESSNVTSCNIIINKL